MAGSVADHPLVRRLASSQDAVLKVSGVFSGVLFAWHPVLMSVGFLGLMTEGLLAAVRFRPLDGQARTSAIFHHAYLQIVSITSIYKNKNRLGKEHFASLHAKTGLVTFGLAMVAPLGGILSFRKLGLLPLLPQQWQAHIKWVHRSWGLLVWSLGIVVVQLAGFKVHIWRLVVNLLAVAMFTHMRKHDRSSRSSSPLELQMNSPNTMTKDH
ncbi:hypothetical protein QBZ16_001574 [Prototheca wickerhamii]|uniref:Cytochrome b561 domain-containing protein n=1 Tax=Prototheca wickerhamii TaxID=3111 RepID=A0AAD9IDF0_PROWI|nr:hypothetical protein QBZ16_001574 [Prototheca wickerhamii]